jgi:hypothetical protein
VVLAYLWRTLSKNRFELVFASALLVAAIFATSEALNASSGVDRFSGNTISEEANLRGVIWKDAIAASVEHPLTGMGFRNFGEEFVSVLPTGEVLEFKDCAHGFFQAVAADHGIFLAVAMLSACVILIKKTFDVSSQLQNSEFAFIAVVIGCSVTDNFSCSDFNGLGYHFIALIPLVVAGIRGKSIKIQPTESGRTDQINGAARGSSEAPSPLIPGRLCL